MQFRFIFVLRERKPDGRMRHPIFLGLFYKSTKKNVYSVCTHIKAKLLQFRLSSWLRGVFASTVRREKTKKSSDSSDTCALTFKLSTLTMQPVHYHYKKQSVKHMTFRLLGTISSQDLKWDTNISHFSTEITWNNLSQEQLLLSAFPSQSKVPRRLGK